MPFQVPNDLIMLGRTVAILSGMCTGLEPDFNLWNQIAPYARKLIEKEAKTGINDWLAEFGNVLQVLIALPSQASRVLAQTESSGLMVQSPQMGREVRSLTKSVDRLTGGLIFVGLLIGGVMFYNAGSITYGQAMLGAALTALLWVLFSRKE
jgi:predicted unusual protein kinase regulating ubiquinone biosynthesis (AarF/ABC1/UbiB family)